MPWPLGESGTLHAHNCGGTQTHRHSTFVHHCIMHRESISNSLPHRGQRTRTNLAGEDGFEPPSPGLEPGSFAAELTPLLAGRAGFEPTFASPEPAVLPFERSAITSPNLVRPRGLEPPRPKAPNFELGVSTNSTKGGKMVPLRGIEPR
jgi:hypothetical protein